MCVSACFRACTCARVFYACTGVLARLVSVVAYFYDTDKNSSDRLNHVLRIGVRGLLLHELDELREHLLRERGGHL